MPALAKVATAMTLALSLAGGVTALAQRTAAVEDHSIYVTMVAHVPGDGDRPVIQGVTACQAPLHERLLRSYMGRPDCRFDGYAYAFPPGVPAPWEGEVRAINDSRYVNADGAVWHVAEIAYRTASQAPEGASELVHAFAAELKPVDRADDGAGARYELPVDEDLVGRSAEDLDVEIGPAPQPTSTTAS